MLRGGCFCGAMRYETDGTPHDQTLCHCSLCRRTTAAPLVAWFTVRRAELRFVLGTPTRFKSSASGTRSFCPVCGTQLTFEHAERGGEIDVTTCSLDEPERVPPRDHTHVHSRLSWVVLADRLPVRE